MACAKRSKRNDLAVNGDTGPPDCESLDVKFIVIELKSSRDSSGGGCATDICWEVK